MDKIRAFDEELTKIYDYENMMTMLMSVMFIFFTGICMLFPAEAMGKEFKIVAFMAFGMGNMSVFQHLYPYMVVGKKSIYERLKWMPVSRREIREVRMGYLNQYCFKIFVIGFSLQQVAALLHRSFGVKSLLYPIVIYLLVWLGGVIQIRIGFK